jgi:hypothetical protein
MTDLNKLVVLYENARDLEADRFLRDETPVYISAWNPRMTMRLSDDRNNRMNAHLKTWTSAWWEQRGYKAIFDTESAGFNVEPIT